MERPRTVTGLCLRTGTPLEELALPCVFCGTHMSQTDLNHFDYAALQLTWKDEGPYGSCVRCLLASSRYEREHHCTGIWPLHEWYGPLNGPLFNEFIRCLYCYAPLTTGEKLQLLLENSCIYQVRGRLRAVCRLCRYLT